MQKEFIFWKVTSSLQKWVIGVIKKDKIESLTVFSWITLPDKLI